MASTASPEALYSFANLGGIDLALFRMRGVGLANCLFPWARCIVATRQFALRRIASTWPQLCHRQWLGPQQDRRTYLGLFDETGSAISGVKRLRLLLGLPRITEQQFLQQSMAHQSGIVVFSNIGGYFSAMLDNHAMVRDALIGMTKSEHRIGLEAVPGNSIVVHVRLGDFHEPPDQTRSAKVGLHTRQPMAWYLHAISELRRVAGAMLPVLVFSDGPDIDLRPILALPNTTRATFGSSIADLLAMSKAPALVASGSTFSMWAAYLGRMPVIWPVGHRRQPLHGADWQFEAELGAEDLPEEVGSLFRKRLLG